MKVINSLETDRKKINELGSVTANAVSDSAHAEQVQDVGQYIYTDICRLNF